ncbi:MAG: AIR carboxylase family protein [Haliscomenobacter sp.]|nr:AIR carboxylase family protein [Haliscomenobacter sp.]
MIVVSIIMGSVSISQLYGRRQTFWRIRVTDRADDRLGHRTPERMFEFARTALEARCAVGYCQGRRCGALPGMVASSLRYPLLACPSNRQFHRRLGLPALHCQMPNGVPVATVAVNAAKNAGILAADLGASNSTIRDIVAAYKKRLAEEVEGKIRESGEKGIKVYHRRKR